MLLSIYGYGFSNRGARVGFGRQMRNHLRAHALEKLPHGLLVADIGSHELKVWVMQKRRYLRLFKLERVRIVKIVDAHNAVTALKELGSKVGTDKAG